MASAPSEAMRDGVQTDRVATLEAELERERQRREAAEAWGEFLERELQAREQRLKSVIDQYERQLEGVQREATAESGGLLARLTGWLQRR